MREDEDWAKRLRAGDNGALKEVFTAYYIQLVNFAYRILGDFSGSRDIAEDIVQDVFARFCIPGADINVKNSLSTYLYTSVRNGAIRAIEQRGRAAYVDTDIASAQPDSHSDQLSSIEYGSMESAAAAAVANLPERTRIVFTMQREQGMTYNQIAGVLGISLSTVKTHMERAVEKLRQDLAEYL